MSGISHPAVKEKDRHGDWLSIEDRKLVDFIEQKVNEELLVGLTKEQIKAIIDRENGGSSLSLLFGEDDAKEVDKRVEAYFKFKQDCNLDIRIHPSGKLFKIAKKNSASNGPACDILYPSTHEGEESLVPRNQKLILYPTPIGTGTYGKVYLAKGYNSGAICAVKEERISPRSTSSRYRAKIEDEINNSQQTGNLYAHASVDPNLVNYLIMPLHPGQDGFDVMAELAENFSNNPYALLQFVYILAKTLQAFHNEGLVHRDFKPENTVVESISGVPISCKIIDFATMISLEDPNSAQSRRDIVGTTEYLDPALVAAHDAGAQKQYSKGTDIYALGAMFAKIYTHIVNNESASKFLEEQAQYYPQLPRNNMSFSQLEMKVLLLLAKYSQIFKGDPAHRVAAVSEFLNEVSSVFDSSLNPNLEQFKLAETIDVRVSPDPSPLIVPSYTRIKEKEGSPAKRGRFAAESSQENHGGFNSPSRTSSHTMPMVTGSASKRQLRL